MQASRRNLLAVLPALSQESYARAYPALAKLGMLQELQVRSSTSRAHTRPCPAPQGPYQQHRASSRPKRPKHCSALALCRIRSPEAKHTTRTLPRERDQLARLCCCCAPNARARSGRVGAASGAAGRRAAQRQADEAPAALARAHRRRSGAARRRRGAGALFPFCFLFLFPPSDVALHARLPCSAFLPKQSGLAAALAASQAVLCVPACPAAAETVPLSRTRSCRCVRATCATLTARPFLALPCCPSLSSRACPSRRRSFRFLSACPAFACVFPRRSCGCVRPHVRHAHRSPFPCSALLPVLEQSSLSLQEAQLPLPLRLPCLCLCLPETQLWLRSSPRAPRSPLALSLLCPAARP